MEGLGAFVPISKPKKQRENNHTSHKKPTVRLITTQVVTFGMRHF